MVNRYWRNAGEPPYKLKQREASWMQWMGKTVGCGYRLLGPAHSC